MKQVAPHNLEAERLILGQALVDNTVIDQISQYIPEEQVFYNTGHQDIWKCILSLHRDGATVIDPITIMSQIRQIWNHRDFILQDSWKMLFLLQTLNTMLNWYMRNG